jgi:hypothetical protein
MTSIKRRATIQFLNYESVRITTPFIEKTFTLSKVTEIVDLIKLRKNFDSNGLAFFAIFSKGNAMEDEDKRDQYFVAIFAKDNKHEGPHMKIEYFWDNAEMERFIYKIWEEE